MIGNNLSLSVAKTSTFRRRTLMGANAPKDDIAALSIFLSIGKSLQFNKS